jgi:hypothetical protein
LSSSAWWSSWLASVGVFFLDVFCGGIVSFFRRRPQWAPMLGDRKVVNPFTRALAPPFIGRRRDFYIPTLPSDLKNIPDVNMYTNTFCIPWFAGLISHIYKPATSSRFEPGLLRQHLWPGPPLTFEPPFAKVANHQDLRTEFQNPQPKRIFSRSLKSSTSRFPRIRQIPVVLKREVDLRSWCQFGNCFTQHQWVSESCKNNETTSWVLFCHETEQQPCDLFTNTFTNSVAPTFREW